LSGPKWPRLWPCQKKPKNQKAKKANKDKKGNKTSEDFSPDQAPAGCPNQKYQETGSITSDEDEPCLK